MTKTGQNFSGFQGEIITAHFAFEPGDLDPTGGEVTLIVLSPAWPVTGTLTAPVNPATAWDVEFSLPLTGGNRLSPGRYAYHVCLDVSGDMRVIATGTFSVFAHPEHPH
jgi:hypothetical protein